MSRRRRTGVLAVFLLAAVVLVWLDHSPIRRAWKPQPKSGQQARALDTAKYHAKTFTVVRVVDGDTIDIDIADGKHEHTRIRLLGIDTPETNSDKYGVMYFGSEAAAFAGKSALGKQVNVYLDDAGPTRGKYGRLLAYVRLPDHSFLNEILLTEGLAYADLRFRHSLYNKYKQLEASARSQRKGLWQDATREQLPEWLQRMKPELLRNK
ncbi:MAG TPA: thermonuclease family protein [Sedimentisphaerales bacterium]|nr:thermonuclease family protein [Sedimentisphaerales bacterium]